jgi:hypothetical protein
MSYTPVGIYVYLKKHGDDYLVYKGSKNILECFEVVDRGLVMDHLLQHRFQNYVEAIKKRTLFKRIDIGMNYYERLGLPKHASVREVRQAYRKHALRWHPDKWINRRPEQREESEKSFRLLAVAYKVLSCPEQTINS